MNKTTLQVKNYPNKELARLKHVCVDRKCQYVDILVPAVKEYLEKKKKK